MKLWAGRFRKELEEKVNDFNSSIAIDRRMFKEDIEGSIAHATMLSECGVISGEDKEKIIGGLLSIKKDIEAGELLIDRTAEDIHMFIEAELTKRIGEPGKRLHTARSRNDQVALDCRMVLKKEIHEIMDLIFSLLEVLKDKAKSHIETIMPGYTHLQRAQPITFAHHLLAYAQMLRRDAGRLSDCLRRMDEMPLGAGALATTTYPIDRMKTAELLGFSRPTENSLDSVSDRDFVLELASSNSILMMHLSRFSEEIIFWCSSECAFIELDDAYSTGSSIMPQKKNPDIAELVRGKTGRTYGSLMALLTMMKALPLAYNKDMQEDKELIFDSVDTVKMCLPIFTDMLKTAKVKEDNMRNAARLGFLNATDCADYLVKKGLPFRDAYKIVGTLVALCLEQGQSLEDLSLKELKEICPAFSEDIYSALALEACVNGRGAFGGPSSEAVRLQIKSLEDFLKEERI